MDAPADTERRCWHVACNKPLPPDPPKGRPRRYCNEGCKSAAYRDRKAAREFVPAIDPVTIRLPEPAPPIQRLALSVAEADTLASILLALAPELPAPLAWRAERMGVGIRELLDSNFEGVVG